MSYTDTQIIRASRTESPWASHTIYNVIMSAISPASAVALSLTCRSVNTAVMDFRSNAFNINRHFSRFFKDPIGFRSLQARTGTLVSGSNALQFMDRTVYEGSDIDIYVNPGHLQEVALFLKDAEGYIFLPGVFSRSTTSSHPMQSSHPFKVKFWELNARCI